MNPRPHPGSESFPLRAFFGHHKCATGWIDRILMEVCYHMGIRLGIIHLPRNFAEYGSLEAYVADQRIDLLSYTNADIEYVRGLPLYRGFHVVRDPRDVLVSAYFSHLHSHGTRGWEELIPHREHLQRLSKEEGLFAEMEFSRPHLSEMATWNYDDPRVLEIKMEDLTRDPLTGFLRIFRFLEMLDETRPGLLRHANLKMNRLNQKGRRYMPGGMPLFPVPRVPLQRIPAVTVDAILERKSFKRLAGGRKRGQENVRSHYRKGVPGDWRNHLTEAHCRRFKELYGDLILKLGYETDPDW